jgi:hypothetical protein
MDRGNESPGASFSEWIATELRCNLSAQVSNIGALACVEAACEVEADADWRRGLG